MGNSCTHAADAVAHLVTEAEIHDAVKSIEEWQKAQANTLRNGGPGQSNCGPLLQRVGGPDVVKKVVELFYRKLYADPHLIKFLHDQDVMHLRAKQSAFVSWLFGPPNTPYIGRSVRIAHLRIIKQRGFCPEDFDLGMRYFEQAMAELGAPELIMGEVMRRMRPFKDAFFTPSMKDGEEEARWVAEERSREEEARQQQEVQHHHEEEVEEHHKQERQLLQQITIAQHEAQLEAEAAEGEDWVADMAVAAAVAAAMSTSAATPKPDSRPTSRGPQCPFTGGRMSRPTSAALAAHGTAPPAAAGSSSPRVSSPRAPSPLKQALAASGSPRAATPTPGAGPSGEATSPRSPTAAAAAAPASPSGGSRPASHLAGGQPGGGGGSSSRPHSGAVTAAAAASSLRRVPSPSAMPPPSPGPSAGRPASVGMGHPPAAAPLAAAAVPDPLAEFEAEIDEIERAYSPAGKPEGGEAGRRAGPLEPASSGRKSAAVF